MVVRRKRPNFLVIVADDLGFSDCGCFGSEIETPNIDKLAAESGAARFTNYHVAAACSPTRSMLMTGTDHHIAGLGELQEMVRNSPAHRGQPGHEGYLNDRVVALPELLADGGYYTCMSGKWHLGVHPDHHPVRRGFKKSFAMLTGCANHYAFEPKYEDLQHEPIRFMETATRAFHAEDDHFVDNDKLPEDFYSSDAYAEKLISYLSERDAKEKAQPFFAYLPFSAPHWPLQAPKASCDKYQGMYDAGPEVLRQRRLVELKKLGMVSQDVKPHQVVLADGSTEFEEWSQLPSAIRESSSRAMEVYAGMVDRMDYNIGRVIDHLKSTGEYDNTFVLFMSDNGAEGASHEASPLVGQTIMNHIDKYYDNSLDNIGRGNSFVWYGSRWAQAATAPSRLYKMHSTQGGCRVPLVVKPPWSSDDSNISSADGLMTDAFCTVMDVVPTILQYAGLKHPGSQYHGREIATLRGRSWLDHLSSLQQRSPVSGTSETTQIHDANYVVGFEVAGSGAVRRGDWKVTFVPAPRGPQRWELFNIRADPGETEDLSTKEPERFEEMLQLWETYKKDVGSVGVAGEYAQGGPETGTRDEFEDPYGWIIKYAGRPEITAERLRYRIPR